MNKNLISIIMPVYNAERYISDAINSVLAQTYMTFEFIIVDDGSKDRSLEICKNYARQDKRIKVFKNVKHQGVGYTLNQALSKVSGKYIARMDADDIMNPNRLFIQVEFFKKNPGFVCVGSFMKEIDENGKVIGIRRVPLDNEKIYERMYYGMGIQNPSLMINRDLVPKNFTWCKTDGILDDLDLLFRLINFGKFANIPEYLMSYRLHDSNLSLSNIKKTFKEAVYIRKNAVNRYGFKPTLKSKIIYSIEKMTVTLLPEKFIYPIYKIFFSNEKLS